MPKVNCYLSFNGTCESAFNFYKSVFGGELTLLRYKDMPSEHPIPESEKNKVLHAYLPISKETSLIGADTSEAFGHKTTFGDNMAVSVTADSEEEAKRIFDALSKKGKVIMPLEKAFWGALFGQFTDQFGVLWMVHYQMNK